MKHSRVVKLEKQSFRFFGYLLRTEKVSIKIKNLNDFLTSPSDSVFTVYNTENEPIKVEKWKVDWYSVEPC